MILNVEYLAAIYLWRDRLLSTTPADPTPKLTPNNITRQIVVCKQMLRKKIKTLINRYDKRDTQLSNTYNGVNIEKHTPSKGEAYEYRYMVNQLVHALESSNNDYDFSIFIFEILQTEQIREKNFKGSSHSGYDNAPEHKGSADACFKIIQDLKGILPKYTKETQTLPPSRSALRRIVVCKG